MAERTTSRFRTTLKEEILQWQTEGLISEELANRLTAHYPILSQGNRTVTIAVTLGAVLVGLGIILFVGTNWPDMPRLVKVVLIITAVIGSYLGGWFCKFEPGNRPRLGSALLLLGSLLYGAAIWLLSQILNFDTNLVEGLSIWALGTAGVAFVTRCRSVTLLLAALVTSLNLSLYAASGNPSDPFALNTLLAFKNTAVYFASTLTTLLLCARARSRSALYVLLAGGLIWTLVTSQLSWIALLSYGTILYCAHFCLKGRFDLLSEPVLYMGAASALTGCFISTLDKSGSGFGSYKFMVINAILLFVVMALAMVGKAAFRQDRHISAPAIAEVSGGLAMLLVGLVAAQCPSEAPRLVLCNLLLVSSLVGIIAVGIRQQKAALINLSIVFVVFDVIARYFDVFFSMMDRSLFFVLGGMILISLGAAAERNRRKLVESLT